MALEERDKEQLVIVRNILEEHAMRRIAPVFYTQVMEPIGLSTKVPSDRALIGKILGRISEESSSDRGVLLSVLVHKKTIGTTRPSRGFFDLATSLNYKYDNQDIFVEEQTKCVFNAYQNNFSGKLYFEGDGAEDIIYVQRLIIRNDSVAFQAKMTWNGTNQILEIDTKAYENIKKLPFTFEITNPKQQGSTNDYHPVMIIFTKFERIRNEVEIEGVVSMLSSAYKFSGALSAF